MNNSDSPASHEEKWTAYLDGKLPAEEAAALEHEHPEAAAERALHSRIIGAMRRHSPVPQMRNTDFFNESILREISPTPAPAPVVPKERRLFSLWRLAFAGLGCVLAAGAIWATFVRGGSGGGGEKQADPYFVQIESVTAGDASLGATVLDADGLKMVWIDGLAQLPNDYVLE